jgi:hypothetical protein
VRPSLRSEVSRFLEENGASTSTTIAYGVNARRGDIDRVLAGPGFSRAEAPDGCRTNGRYFNLSRAVPGAAKRASRAVVMLEILSDGDRHSRAEIIDALIAAGASLFTNNAAAELRSQGHEVITGRENGEVYYRLILDEAKAA